MTPPRTLVLGYGNPGRQDDGLGPAVATAIAQAGWPGVTAYDNYQLNIEDAVDVAEHDIVWFVDAGRTGPAPYFISCVAAAADFHFTSHLVRPELILALAAQYFGRAPTAFLLGIRGYAFEFVERITPAATENMQAALVMLGERLGGGQAALPP